MTVWHSIMWNSMSVLRSGLIFLSRFKGLLSLGIKILFWFLKVVTNVSAGEGDDMRFVSNQWIVQSEWSLNITFLTTLQQSLPGLPGPDFLTSWAQRQRFKYLNSHSLSDISHIFTASVSAVFFLAWDINITCISHKPWIERKSKVSVGIIIAEWISHRTGMPWI